MYTTCCVCVGAYSSDSSHTLILNARRSLTALDGPERERERERERGTTHPYTRTYFMGRREATCQRNFPIKHLFPKLYIIYVTCCVQHAHLLLRDEWADFLVLSDEERAFCHFETSRKSRRGAIVVKLYVCIQLYMLYSCCSSCVLTSKAIFSFCFFLKLYHY